MKKREKVQKITSFLLVFVMLLGLFIPTKSVLAEGNSVPVTFTRFKITDIFGEVPADGFTSNIQFQLHYDWNVATDTVFKEGDYYEMDLPKEFKLLSDPSYCNFPIKDNQTGKVLANAVVEPDTEGGGKMKVTFTSEVAGKNNIRVKDMKLTGKWNEHKFPVNGEMKYTVKSANLEDTITIKPYVGHVKLIDKTSGQGLLPNGWVRWRVKINEKGQDINDVVLTDTVTAKDPGSPDGIEYIPGQFILAELVKEGDKLVEKNPKNVSNEVTISADKRTFTYRVGDIGTKSYILHYRTTYRDGLVLNNRGNLKFNGDKNTPYELKNTWGIFTNPTNTGLGEGDLRSKIKILKVAKDNKDIKLKGAKFKITRKETGGFIELTTDSEGKAISIQLIPGEYTIKELEAPEKYLLDSTEQTVTVKAGELTETKIENEPEKIDVKVKKEWVGGVGDSITATLKAKGLVVASHKLSAPSWNHTFTGLRKYDAVTGDPIEYSVEEEKIPQGYSKEIKGSIKDGFTITNKKDPFMPYNPGSSDPGKVDGNDRIETAINISKRHYDKAKTVIVVRHDLFPDSMTSSVLAKLKDAPILLNPTGKLDPRVGAEIKRLGAEEVIIVGGESSVSEKVREELKAYDKDKKVERISGVDRYGTSEMVAKRVTGITGKKNIGVIASGQVFPDALSVGTFASRDGYPILLVKKNLVPDQVVRAIKDLDINKTYIAGGTNTISKSTEAKLPGVLERMAGKDRYETSVAIAKSKFKDSAEAFIASGEEFADALVISPISGKYNRPTLLVSRNKNTNIVVKKYIEDSYLTSITGIGGEKYLPYSVLLDLVGK